MGSYVMSESTGIIFNDEMDDFSTPTAGDGLLPAPANFIIPRNSPLSSMSPTIVLNEQNDVTLVLGGAGGIRIATSVIQVILNYLYLNQSIESSLALKRFHHQLQPMFVRHEEGYDPEILKFLESKGHVLFEQPALLSAFASIMVIGRRDGHLEAATDPRRGGKATVF